MTRYILIALLFALGLSGADAHAQTAAQSHKKKVSKGVPDIDYMLNNSAQGTEFYLAMPPNEMISYGDGEYNLFIASAFDTEVEVRLAAGGVRTFQIKAYSVVSVGNTGANSMALREVRLAGVSREAIIIKSTKPVSVYVLNSKVTTSDGYLALPTSTWGTKYIHVGYWDRDEGWSKFGGGFVVVARENATQVIVRLRGVQESGTINIDRKLNGQTVSYLLNAGDVLMIKGNGDSRLQLDLTGTEIRSTRPVGLISFHERTALPMSDNASRDHLCEMIPPVSTWGKEYVSLELQRYGRGDFFRIVAAEDGTQFECTYYDKNTGAVIGAMSGQLKAGEFQDYGEYTPPAYSIRGVAVWKANKPIFVMQYSYSAAWDGDNNLDPFMVNVIPVEQYTQETIFQTPSGISDFKNNLLNLIVEMDPSDPSLEALKSLEMDGRPVWQLYPAFLASGRRIPGTNLHWVTVDNVAPGSHVLKSKTRFGGYIYGYTSVDSYGWPAATALNKIDELDTLQPELTKVDNCGDYQVTATEIRNGDPNKDPADSLQVDSGIAGIQLVEGQSQNYNLIIAPADQERILVQTPKTTRLTFELKVIDPTQYAKALFVVRDWYGNITLDSVEYTPEVVAFVPSAVDYGNVRVGTATTQKVKFVNSTNRPVTVTKLYTERRLGIGATPFTILSGISIGQYALPYEMAVGEEIETEIQYQPINETTSLTDPKAVDLDSVFVELSCRKLPLGELRGRGVLPHIAVEDFDAGNVIVGETVCKSLGLTITNTGTMALEVYSLEGYAAPFTVSNPTDPVLPVSIAPGQSIKLKLVCFAPTETGLREQTITVRSNIDNTPKDDSLSEWRGTGIQADVFITSHDWDVFRVGSTPQNNAQLQTATVYMRNNGTAPVNISKIDLGTPADPNFRILGASYRGAAVPDWTNMAIPLSLVPYNANNAEQTQIAISVEFTPTAEGPSENTVTGQAATGEVSPGRLTGAGMIPQVAGEGFDWTALGSCIEVGTKHPTVGNVVITNASQSEDLTVSQVRIANESLPGSFAWAPGAVLTNFVVAKGGSVSIPVEYNALINGNQTATVEILSDAHRQDATVKPTVTTVDLKGCGITNGSPLLVATGDDLGLAMACDNLTGTLTIRNEGTTNLVVTNVVLSGDVANFAFLETLPIPGATLTLAPQEEKVYQVQFIPTPKVSGPYVVVANISSNDVSNPNYAVELRAAARVESFQVSIGSVSGGVIPGQKLTGASAVPLRLSGSEWQGINTTRVEFSLSYPKEALRISRVNAQNGFTVSASTRIDGNQELTDFVVTSPNPISGNVDIATLDLDIFLVNPADHNKGNDVYGFDLLLAPGEVQRANCVAMTTEDGFIPLSEFCIADYRAIRVTGNTFALKAPTPNPVQSATLQFEYSVGFDAQTDITLFDVMGNKVADIVGGKVLAGAHVATLDLTNIPNGTYLCSMRSGPFSTVEKIVISR